jgi:type IV pilus assembly protein PilC
MPTYEFQARDRNGQVEAGVLVAEDVNSLRNLLRARDLYLTSNAVVADHAISKGTTSVAANRRIKLNDLVVMSRQLATLFRSGIPVVECLDAAAEQSETVKLQVILKEVRADIIDGQSLSEAFGKHSKVFGTTYAALVHAGEHGGTLEETLDLAAELIDRQAELKAKVVSAVTYPILVVVAALGVVLFMVAFIVPVFKKVYTQFGAELPGPTKLLVSMSDILVQYWYWCILAIVGLIFAFRWFHGTPQGRRLVDRILLKIPLLGPVLRKISIAQFTDTFAGMTRGGVPIVSGLQSAADTAGNVIINDAIMDAAERLKVGSPLAMSLQESGQFQPMATRMIAAGEKSGSLDEMLDELNRFYRRDIDHSVDRMARMIEPILTVVVGGLVLFILLALYMPVFSLGQVIKK